MTLQKNVVCRISYKCRDIGYGAERGKFKGYWTGAIDTWGKLTVCSLDNGQTFYLFKDEITKVEEN